jgi:hypothetical protein
MDPRNDFIPFTPVEDWYESTWLQPKPTKQATGSGVPRGLPPLLQRIMRAVFQWPASVDYRDTAPDPETFPR